MAHIAKYKAPSVGHMLAHYRRDESSLERDNIDQSLTKRNVTFGHVTNDQGGVVVRSGVDLKPNWDTVNARIQTVNARAAATGKRATRKDELVAQVADGERRLSDVRMQVDEETDRLECLRQRADGVARDVAELEPIAADVRRFEGAGRAERGTILDSIAARCAGAARAARAAIEELGDRIWALMRLRKPKTEQRSLDDVMREATEAARASEALSRNHVTPTNSRPRGQAR